MQTLHDVRDVFTTNYNPDAEVQELFGMGFVLTDTALFHDVEPKVDALDPQSEDIARAVTALAEVGRGSLCFAYPEDDYREYFFYLRKGMLFTVAQLGDEDAVAGFATDVAHVTNAAARVTAKYLDEYGVDLQPGPVVWQAAKLTVLPADYHLIEENLMAQIVTAARESSNCGATVWGALVVDGEGRPGQVYVTRRTDDQACSGCELAAEPDGCVANHAEMELIGSVGLAALTGRDIWVSAMPCPVCLRALARAQVKRVFYGVAGAEDITPDAALGLDLRRVLLPTS